MSNNRRRSWHLNHVFWLRGDPVSHEDIGTTRATDPDSADGDDLPAGAHAAPARHVPALPTAPPQSSARPVSTGGGRPTIRAPNRPSSTTPPQSPSARADSDAGRPTIQTARRPTHTTPPRSPSIRSASDSGERPTIQTARRPSYGTSPRSQSSTVSWRSSTASGVNYWPWLTADDRVPLRQSFEDSEDRQTYVWTNSSDYERHAFVSTELEERQTFAEWPGDYEERRTLVNCGRSFHRYDIESTNASDIADVFDWDSSQRTDEEFEDRLTYVPDDSDRGVFLPPDTWAQDGRSTYRRNYYMFDDYDDFEDEFSFERYINHGTHSFYHTFDDSSRATFEDLPDDMQPEDYDAIAASIRSAREEKERREKERQEIQRDLKELPMAFTVVARAAKKELPLTRDIASDIAAFLGSEERDSVTSTGSVTKTSVKLRQWISTRL